jgi:hypothetical protein
MAEKKNGSMKTASSASPGGEAGGAPLTKMDAVRQALATLGKDAKPIQLQGHIRKEFGIEMSTDHISTYKGNILRKKGGKGRRGGKKAAAKPSEAPAAAPAALVPKVGGRGANVAVSMGDLQALKDLVQRVGANNLRSLIDLMGR